MAAVTGANIPKHVPYTTITSLDADIPSYLGYINAIIDDVASWFLPPLQQSIGSIVEGSELIICNSSSNPIVLIADGSDQIYIGTLVTEIFIPPNTTTVIVAADIQWTAASLVFNSFDGPFDVANKTAKNTSIEVIKAKYSQQIAKLQAKKSGFVTLDESARFVVLDTNIQANSRIMCTVQPGQAPLGTIWISEIVAGERFTISSTNILDAGVNVFYQIVD